jgi:hypothetical protein
LGLLRLPGGGQKSSAVLSKESGPKGIVGEIKSTIDLVLEKTKDLALSGDEKVELARRELENKVLGFINRYVDNLLPLNQLKEELEKIDTEARGLAYRLFKKNLLAHFSLDIDNTSLLSALREISGFDTEPLAILQKEYQSAKEESRRSFTERILADLKDRRISGSAVVANLDQDPEWNQLLKDLRESYQERIRTIENG